MKNIIYIVFILLVATSNVSLSQSWGVRGGLNASYTNVKTEFVSVLPPATYYPFLSGHLGLMADVQLKEKLRFESGLFLAHRGLYSRTNLRDSLDTYKYKLTQHSLFLEVPLLLKGEKSIGDIKLIGTIGPLVGITLWGYFKQTREDNGVINRDVTIKDRVKIGISDDNNFGRFDIGLQTGIGFEKGLYQLRLHYGFSLFDYSPIDGIFTRHHVAQLSLGYTLGQLSFGRKEKE